MSSVLYQLKVGEIITCDECRSPTRTMFFKHECGRHTLDNKKYCALCFASKERIMQQDRGLGVCIKCGCLWTDFINKRDRSIFLAELMHMIRENLPSDSDSTETYIEEDEDFESCLLYSYSEDTVDDRCETPHATEIFRGVSSERKQESCSSNSDQWSSERDGLIQQYRSKEPKQIQHGDELISDDVTTIPNHMPSITNLGSHSLSNTNSNNTPKKKNRVDDYQISSCCFFG